MPLEASNPPNSTARKQGATKTTSDALVTRGAREVAVSSAVGRRGGIRPSTSKALVLRNGKHGAQGTGEITLFSNKVFGQEKLDLLAEDMMKTAIRAPIDLGTLIRMAESQLEVHISQINNLRDADFFYSDIITEIESRSTLSSTEKSNDYTNDPGVIAGAIGYRVHNAYALASSWKLIFLISEELRKLGVTNVSVKTMIVQDNAIYQLFTHLFGILENLAELGLSCVRSLAMASEHYAPYFIQAQDGTLKFDRAKLKDIYKSYIDSIIIELVLPQSRYPPHVLFACLHDCLQEAPKEGRRFPQLMWDAVGDLSITVRCLDMVEMALLGLVPSVSGSSPILQRFQEAQRLSTEVSSATSSYQNLIQPLSLMKQQDNLDKLWAEIDRNYKTITGVEVDILWELTNDRAPDPQWTLSVNSPSQSISGASMIKSINKKTPKLISNTAVRTDDDNMPGLMTVSDSSDLIDNSDDQFAGSDQSYESDSEYDTEDEDHIRELLREAMDATSANPELLDPTLPDPPQAKNNGFLRALRHLAGRVFSGDPALTVDSQPRKAFFGPERPSTSSTAPKLSPAKTEGSRGLLRMQATVEDADDEDIPSKKKKRKKKSKKKKRAATTNGGEALLEEADDPEEAKSDVPPLEPLPAQPLSPKKAKANFDSRKPSLDKSNTVKQGQSIYPLGAVLPSSISLIHPTAQSARSYLKAEHLLDERTKPKSRPNPELLQPASPKRFFDKSKKPENSEEGSTKSFLSRAKQVISKKTGAALARFLPSGASEKGSLKWDAFVKMMADMGFTMDGSTAGSSVRFDPPNLNDKSITIHKPHPDPTLTPVLIKKIRKRLNNRYDWKEDQFITVN